MTGCPHSPPPPARAGRPAGRRLALGRRGEQLACEHLRRLGFEILARNVRSREGELDVVARHGASVVFVEVKTRAVSRARERQAQPLHWLHAAQLHRQRGLAVAWLSGEGRAARAGSIRFDAIGVVVDPSWHLLRLDHVQDAW